MNSGMRKTTLREIKSSFGRYMAILLIVALGVGFFAGLKMSYEVMLHSANTYWERLQLFDYQLLSTMGFDEDTAEQLMKEQEVLAAEGSKSADVLLCTEDGTDLAFKMLSITEKLNVVEVLEGRMPESEDECLVDIQAFDTEYLGKTLKVSENNEEEDGDNFKVKEYTVVGLVRSPLYGLSSRGTTDVGNGSLEGFVYIQDSAFNMDYDTEIYVTFRQAEVIYSDGYAAYMDAKEEEWETITQRVADVRYQRIYDEALSDIAEGENELADKEAEGKQELTDAYQEIQDGKNELADGESALTSAKNTLKENEKTFSDKEQEYKEGLKEYKKGLKAYQKGKKAYEEGLATYNQNYETYQTSVTEYKEGKAAYDASEVEYAAAKAQFEAGKDYLSAEERLAMETQLSTWRATLDATATELAAAKTQLDTAAAEFATAKATLEKTDKELKSADKELKKAKKQLDKAVKQIESAKTQFADAKKQITANENKLQDAKTELADGEQEYADAKKEFEEKIAEAKEEIEEGREELEDLEKPEIFVLGRETNVGYASFENDAAIIDGVAKIFPIFFFLVAAMVCMTTMSRMIEEQRTQIGVLKALGYSSNAIIGKYLTYSGSAAVFGSIGGYFAGTWVFSVVIWTSYKMMYDLGDMYYVMNVGLLVLATVVAVICSAGTTFVVCRNELKEMAATLMRPKAPKAGKRVWMEKLPFIWNRLKFLDKVSIRNLFRYKRRFFMMIIGVSGCTALLVAGLGVNDSIGTIPETQYTEISLYDMMVYMDEEPERVEGILDSLLLLEKSVDVSTKEKTKDESLLVISDETAFSNYMDLHTKAGDKVFLPATDAVIVPIKMADLMELEVGDTLTLQNSDLKGGEVVISAIYESYTDNFIMMLPETYEKLFDEKVEYNQMFINLEENADAHQVASRLMKQENVTRVSVCEDVKAQIEDMLGSLYYVVILVVVFAAMLAFVVIYNLNNINITERVREIATIKVLGFYKEETKSYVFRENTVLTLIGSLVGLVLGYVLHGSILNQIQVDMVAFDVHVEPLSFVLSVILTLVFNQIVNLFMAGKLEKIDMAESLKSVE